MTKTELISAVALKAELTKKDSEKAVAAVFDTITEALVAGDSVSLVGFGKFEVKTLRFDGKLTELPGMEI